MIKNKFKTVAVVLMLVHCGAGAFASEQANATRQEPTVASILERYISAIGGREALEKLTDRTCAGKEVTDFTLRKPPTYESLHLKVHTKVPTSYLLKKWSDMISHQEGYDGKIGWVKNENGVRNDDKAGMGKLAFLLNPQGSLHIKTYFPGLKFAGKSVVDGTEAYALEPDSSLPPEHYTLYFSAESGLLVAIGYYWAIKDYREVDGVMIPHQITRSRKGGSTVCELTTVTHNLALSDSLFAMPGQPD